MVLLGFPLRAKRELRLLALSNILTINNSDGFSFRQLVLHRGRTGESG